MKKLLYFISFAMIFGVLIVSCEFTSYSPEDDMIEAENATLTIQGAGGEVILFEDFEDTSRLTISGSARYWGVASLSGTLSFPSQFAQGGSQSGKIFYGINGYNKPTMTISLPALTGYTNLQMTVALAAPDGTRWESSHRDSLIISGTTGLIDSFLPISRGAPLQSQIHHPTVLHYEFQDFNYTIDSSMVSLTFTFESTANDEVIGIDSVRITGNLLSEPVEIDIKPGSCPNPLNTKSKGVFPVAILGTATFNVDDIDVSSIRLEGVEPIRYSYEDVATPFIGELGDCHDLGADEYIDMTLKFDTQAIVDAIGEVDDGDEIILTLNGNLNDGTDFEGSDSVWIIKK